MIRGGAGTVVPGEGLETLYLFPHSVLYTSLPSGWSSIYFVVPFYSKLVVTVESLSPVGLLATSWTTAC